MKKNKVTQDIMNRVVKYERSQTNKTIEVWAVMILGLISLLVLVSVDLLEQANTLGFGDLFGMVLGDLEILKDFGDILWETTVEEFPWLALIKVLFLLIVLIVIGGIFKNKVVLARKKWNYIKKFLSHSDRK